MSGISTDMLCFTASIIGLVGTLHHFKGHIKFGKFTGRVITVLNFIRRVLHIPGEFTKPGQKEAQARYERMMAVLIMLGAGSALIAAAGELSLIWDFAKTWILALIGVAGIGAIWTWHLIVRGNGHDVIMTNSVAALQGIVMALLWGGWAGLDSAAGLAFNDVEHLSQDAASGHAPTQAAHVSAGAQHLAALAFWVIVAGLAITVAVRVRLKAKAAKPAKNRKNKKGASGGSGRGAAVGGGGMGDLPVGGGYGNALPDAYGS